MPDKPPEEEDEYKVGGSYNVLIDPAEEEKKRLAAEAEKNKKKEKKKAAPRIEIKVKELKDKKKWLLVRRSLPMFFSGTGVWAGAMLLSTLVVVIGMFSSSNYPETANELLLEKIPPMRRRASCPAPTRSRSPWGSWPAWTPRGLLESCTSLPWSSS